MTPRARPGSRRVRAALLLAALAASGGCDRAEPPIEESRPVAVRLETVEPRPFRPVLHLLGVVEPRDRVAITARTTGPIRYPAAHAGGFRSGTRVAAGDLLAWQSDPNRDYLVEVARLEKEAAVAELERHRKSWEEGLESRATYQGFVLRAELAEQRLKAAQAERLDLQIRAPIAGRLQVERRFPPGTDLDAGAVLGEILTEDRQIKAWASGGDLERLTVGQAANVYGARGLAAPAEATVSEITPQVSQGGSYTVALRPAAGAELPAIGEGVEVEVRLETRERALTLPEGALLTVSDGASVFVAVPSGGEMLAERRTVLVGERAGDARGEGRVEILRGLSSGERVVVDGVSILTDGTPIVGSSSPASGTVVETESDTSEPPG